ncbi:MAG TPA: nitroreductase family deazaflavin-dependent oxidoreductase [Chloroflexota bacterium]|jgi:deazaflavin-dependent oxidoreductase (nitroreductase family)|nr:nitroreductase family deazaflavin-dependent oxidoreductase [Chloroflexota bacterium]
MPAPRWLARFNRRATNRVLGALADRLPGFGVVVHRGRTTGRRYRTPVNVFRRAGRYVIALTYGPESEWVRNVQASGGCALETRGHTLRLARPRLFHDERRRSVPAPVRLVLGLLGVSDFLELVPDDRAAESAGPGSAATAVEPGQIDPARR